MKLNANPLISRHTSTSSRSLLAFSATVFLISVYDLGNNSDVTQQEGVILSNWTIFGVQIPDSMFVFAVIALLFFFLMNHILHWWADYQSYTKWFDLNSVPIGYIGTTGTLHDNESPVESIKRKLGELLTQINAQENKDFNNQNVETLTDSISRLNEVLSRMEKNFKEVSQISKFHIFGWYLGLPIVVWAAAFFTFLCKYVLR